MRVATWAIVGLVGVCACADPVDDTPFTGSINGSCSESLAITRGEYAGSGMPDKSLALTFDDGPSEVTEGLSAYLKSQGIAATFFINGMNVPGREAVLERQVKDGHLLANHTQTHASLVSLDPSAVIAEVEQTDAVLSAYVSPDKLFFRPPFGAWSDEVTNTLSGSAMGKYEGPIGWDVGGSLTDQSAADWDCWEEHDNGTRTVEQCGDLYLKEIHAKGHGVVLMHDGPPGTDRAKTVEMIKYIVPILKSEGYAFSRVDEVKLQPLGVAPGGGSWGDAGAAPCR